MSLQNVRFLNGGYCLQSKYLSGVPELGWRRFQAVFVYFEHPRGGRCLIDTGYSTNFFAATTGWPWRLMRWATPVPKQQPFMSPDYLRRQGIEALQIEHVFLSHFHADHIAAAKLYSNSRFVYRSSSLDALRNLSPGQQLRQGFIPSLLPADFLQRSVPISETQLSSNDNRLVGFPSSDYFGDGSLLLIDLPGHAAGHTGFLLDADPNRYLYVVDAFWDRTVFESERRLPWISQGVQHGYSQYKETNRRLRHVASELGLDPLACHCPRTQEYVQPIAN